MTMPSLTDFEALSFDCYGTLIDWEPGLLAALEPLLVRASPRPEADEVLQAYAEAEGAAEAAHPADPYPQILARCWSALAAQFGAGEDEAERECFAQSVGDWPAFPDSPQAL